MMCGLRFEKSDPGAQWFCRQMLMYLDGEEFPETPAAEANLLKKLIRQEFPDSGIAKTDEAWDPNVSGGKKSTTKF